MYTQQQTHEILVKARNYLEEHGWQAGWNNAANQYVDSSTCLMGSIGKALGYILPSRVLDDCAAREHFPQVLGFATIDTLILYNDRSSTTRTQILEKLDKAIAETAPEPSDPVPSEAVIETSHDFTL